MEPRDDQDVLFGMYALVVVETKREGLVGVVEVFVCWFVRCSFVEGRMKTKVR